MSTRGPQSLHSPVPDNVVAQGKKLHQLSAPARPTFNVLEELGGGGGSGGPSSWDESEVARQIAILTEERDFLRKYGTGFFNRSLLQHFTRIELQTRIF